MGFVDHEPGGTGEPVAALLRPGNADSDTAADHITAAQLALSQLPKEYRRGRRTLIRTDSAGGTHSGGHPEILARALDRTGPGRAAWGGCRPPWSPVPSPRYDLGPCQDG